MSGDGYTVSPDMLQEAANGINDTIDALKGLGIDEEAETGRGFGNLSMTGMTIGHAGLQKAFDGFTDRWSWGVRTLVQDGNQFAERLGLCAGTYYDMEQYGVGLLKDAANTFAGDPHAGEQQVENESFSQIVEQDKPDYSAASWKKTGEDAATTWKAEGRDVFEGQMGMNKTLADLAGEGQQFDKAEDQLFGPPPQAK